MTLQLARLPDAFAATRDAARTVACYVLGPARKAVDGRIGLRPTGDGIGTPPFGEHARRLVLRGAHLVVEEGGAAVARAAITTLADAAALAGVELTADPGVGHDLPPFDPDAPLVLDAEGFAALAAWYAFADMVLVDVREAVAAKGTASGLNLWPEHFDLAFDWGPDATNRVNIGASPGDGFSAEPYVYLGPWSFDGRRDDYWNASFGATIGYEALRVEADPKATAVGFVLEGLARLGF